MSERRDMQGSELRLAASNGAGENSNMFSDLIAPRGFHVCEQRSSIGFRGPFVVMKKYQKMDWIYVRHSEGPLRMTRAVALTKGVVP